MRREGKTGDGMLQKTERKSNIDERYEFRAIRPEETEEAGDLEEICFPPHEACSRQMMRERICAAPEMFLVAIDRESGRMAGFLSGLSTDENAFRDAFFSDPSLYDPHGKNVMLLGLNVHPEYRLQGLGRELIRRYARRSLQNGRERLILTCLDEKVAMYSKMGFRDLGESASSWGGEKWHEMELRL